MLAESVARDAEQKMGRLKNLEKETDTTSEEVTL